MRGLALALSLSLLCLALAGCGGKEVVEPTAETVIGTLPQEAPVTGGDAEAGKAIFTAQGCNS